MSEQKIILICMRLSECPVIVDAIAPCGTCGEEVGISLESRKVYVSNPGVHEIRCGPCHHKIAGPMTLNDIEQMLNQMSPGQLREVEEAMRLMQNRELQ